MAALPQTDDRLARRNVAVLVAAQAILGAQMPMIFIMAGLVGNTLTPVHCLATLPISCTVLGSMVAATPISGLMQRHGRTAGFVFGALCGAAGAAIAFAGLYLASFGLLLVGSFLSGFQMSSQGMYRFAAADTASDAFRPKAISWVMAGGLLSAVVGPQVVKATTDLTVIPFMSTYATVVAINLVGLLLFFALRIPKPAQPVAGASGRSRAELLRSPVIAVSIICATVSYALMNLVMTSTPLAMVGCGFSTANAADVVGAHVLAMFAPSFVTGHIIARFGALRVIAVGLSILAGAGIVAISGVDLGNFYIALILMGLGWNFGFIGATTLLTQSQRPEERGRLQGMNDMIVFGGVTFASLASGGLMNCAGGSPESGWQMVNLAMLPFLILAAGALAWLWRQPRLAVG